MVVNELQLALIGLGAAAVIGVWAYNKWQERKHFKLAEKVFKGQQPDVLMDDDPNATLVDAPAPAMEAPAAPAARVE
ncbi:MAG: cell division protein FtsZ, partial [Rhodocyclaceae bacterium]|nr:cell division protein FtsZ [Rhodocyclaceae bacterium]